MEAKIAYRRSGGGWRNVLGILARIVEEGVG